MRRHLFGLLRTKSVRRPPRYKSAPLRNRGGSLVLYRRTQLGYIISIIAALIGAVFVWGTPSVKAALPAPGGVDNEALWLKANDGISTNAIWVDHSANANNGTQSAAAFQPVLQSGSSTDGINYNPTYRFDNTDDRFNINGQLMPLGSGGLTVLYVSAKVNNKLCGAVSACNTVVGWGTDALDNSGGRFTTLVGNGRRQIETAGNVWGTPATTLTLSPGVASYIKPPNSTLQQTKIRFNAGMPLDMQPIIQGTNVINITSPTTTAYIGQTTTRSQSWFFGGTMAEVIVYPSALSDADRLKAESYLAIKYGITLDQTTPQNYLNSAGSAIWTGDAAYKYNITGIGRDDNSTLNQKQSKSVNPQGIVTVGHSTIAPDNAANTNNFIADNSFLLFGDDNGSVGSWIDTGVPALDGQNFMRTPRTWKVQKTGTVNPLTISFDVDNPAANIADPREHYFLLNLTTGMATPLTSSDGRNYSVASVTFNDGDVFTIGTSDYNVYFQKTVSPAQAAALGQTFTYTITAENLENTPQTVSFSDDLADVIDDATYNNDVSATAGTVTFNSSSNHIEWNGSLNVGQTATITYTVTQDQPDTGNGHLNNGVTASGTGVNCTASPAIYPECRTSVTIDNVGNPSSNSGLADTGQPIAIAVIGALTLVAGGSIAAWLLRRRE